MKLKRITEIAHTPLWRGVGVLLGLAAVGLLLRHAGMERVFATLLRAAPYFPMVLFLEIAMLGASMCALRQMYTEAGYKVPLGAMVRTGLIGYAVMGLVPAGRTLAESTRATQLSRYASPPFAAATAARMQGLVLLANAVISVFALAATYSVLGWSWIVFAIAGNLLATTVAGLGIFFMGRLKVGGWVGRKFPKAKKFGNEFDSHFSNQTLLPTRSLFYEILGRLIQVLQNGVLVAAVGGAVGIVPALCSEALHLVGAAAGDLIPAQLGATELNYRLSAHALSLLPADAIAIALLAHLAQIFWVVVGLGVSLLWQRNHPSLAAKAVKAAKKQS